jgi:uncharacterized coiled-coil protein SlyX
MQPFDSDETRLAKLEIALAHLQRDYDTLNTVVTEHADQLDRLLANYSRMQQQLASMRLAIDHVTPRRLEDERPPHY